MVLEAIYIKKKKEKRDQEITFHQIHSWSLLSSLVKSKTWSDGHMKTKTFPPFGNWAVIMEADKRVVIALVLVYSRLWSWSSAAWAV